MIYQYSVEFYNNIYNYEKRTQTDQSVNREIGNTNQSVQPERSNAKDRSYRSEKFEYAPESR